MRPLVVSVTPKSFRVTVSAMASKKKRTGRPPRKGGARTTRTYRADDREFRLIERAARRSGTSTAEWVRETLLEAARAAAGR